VQAEDATNISHIQESMDIFPEWDWAFGQTPEFTYSINRSFGWGNVAAEIRSKHGVILSCTFTVDGTPNLEWLEKLGGKLEGQRYGFLDNNLTEYDGGGRTQEVRQWLIEEMAT